MFRMSQITSQGITTRLKRLFVSHGLPEQIVTGNATTFTSEEFQPVVKQNGIRHTTSAPGHPSTNGLAERYVQTFKEVWKNLLTQLQTLRTHCHYSCCNIGRRLTAQLDFQQGWIFSNPAPRSLCARDSTNKTTSTTAVLQILSSKRILLCNCAALWEVATSGFLDWSWDRLVLCHMKSESGTWHSTQTRHGDQLWACVIAEPGTGCTGLQAEHLDWQDGSSAHSDSVTLLCHHQSSWSLNLWLWGAQTVT